MLEEPKLGFGSADIAGQDEPIHQEPQFASAFNFERFGERDFLAAADVNRMTLVDRGCWDVEDPILAGRPAPARLLREHRERREFVHQAQLALSLAALGNLA